MVTHYRSKYNTVLLNSARDEQQVERFGRQLKKVEFIRDSHKKATTEPYCLFMIDLDPKTSDSFRFCFKIVGLGATIFYVPSNLAKETPLTNEREKLADTEALATQKNQEILQKVPLRV